MFTPKSSLMGTMLREVEQHIHGHVFVDNTLEPGGGDVNVPAKAGWMLN